MENVFHIVTTLSLCVTDNLQTSPTVLKVIYTKMFFLRLFTHVVMCFCFIQHVIFLTTLAFLLLGQSRHTICGALWEL